MVDPISLSLTQQFEQERMLRAIDTTSDPIALRSLCKQLLQAWMVQQAATHWAMRQGLPQGLLGAPGMPPPPPPQ